MSIKYRNRKAANTLATPQEADAAIFTPDGSASSPSNGDGQPIGEITTRSIPLSNISPDPGQPRRIIPASVRAAASGELPHLFDRWAVMAFRESSGNDASAMQSHELYRAMIEGRLEDEAWELPEKPGYVEASILAVAELAASIRQVGLTNPITVAPAPEGLVDTEYIIETGERRFWAYRLLNFYYGGGQGVDHSLRSDWSKIPAKVQPKLDIWKQAAENNQRSDLNAIGKARQFSILLMDLLQTEEYEKAKAKNRAAVRLFAPITGFAREQEFYAQVADAVKWRLPYGKIELLVPAMGMKTSGTLSQYRSFLKLPPEVWIEADDKNYSRDSLLQIVYAVNNLDDERVDFTKQNVRDANNSGASQGGSISQVAPTPPSKPAPNLTPNPSPQAERGGNIPQNISQPDPEESVIVPGKWVYTSTERIGIVTKRINTLLVEVDIDGHFGPYRLDSLKPAPMKIGMAVRTRTRHIGWIMGGVGTASVQVKYNGSITTHHPDTLKPVNRAPEKPDELEQDQVRRYQLSDYPNISQQPAWIDRYKSLSKLHKLLFLQTSYGHMALREDAKAAEALMQSTLPTAWRIENTEHGMAFFALEYRVIEEIAKSSPVALYVDHNDVASINGFWVTHAMKQKPSSLNAPVQSNIPEFAVPGEWFGRLTNNQVQVGDQVEAKGHPGQLLTVVEVHPDKKTGDPQKTLLTLRSEKVMIPLILVTQVTKVADSDWEYQQPDPQPTSAVPEAAPKLLMSDVRNAFEELFTDDYDADDLDILRRFCIQKSHDLGLLTPWDFDTAITAWLAEDMLHDGEVAGLTLERIEAAQHVLGRARAWLGK